MESEIRTSERILLDRGNTIEGVREQLMLDREKKRVDRVRCC